MIIPSKVKRVVILRGRKGAVIGKEFAGDEVCFNFGL